MDYDDICRKFPTEDACIGHIEKVRWNGGVTCPYCHSKRASESKSDNRYHCNNCNTSFSVTVGTIFHHTHLPLQKWFLAISLLLSAKEDITTRQLGRDLEVNRNTAWYLAARIRKAMNQPDEREILQGILVAIIPEG